MSYTMILDLSGIYPPVPTAFDNSGNVDVNTIKKNIKYFSNFDLRGYVILGSNGEFAILKYNEKIKILQASREEIPSNKLLIAGTGCDSTIETIELTQEAAKIGADAALIITPYYYKPRMTHDALVKHYHAVADKSPIPIIIYNMPACTGVDLAVETILAIAEHPNVIGLKESGGNIVKIGEVRRKTNKDFQLIAGSAGFLLPALAVGACAGILALANIATQECIDVYKLFKNNEIDKAREIQLRLIPINNAVTSKWGIPALKAAMDIIGLDGGPVRMPLQPITDCERTQLISILNNCDIKKVK